METIETKIIASMNEGALGREIDKWLAPDTLMMPSHPRYPEYKDIQNHAVSTLRRMSLTLKMGGAGVDLFSKQAEEVADLYAKALEIRSAMVVDGMRGLFRVPAGKSFEAAIEERVNAAVSGMEKRGDTIGKDLRAIGLGLGKNPADVRNGDKDGNYFYFTSGEAAGMVNFDQVAKAEGILRDLERTKGATPGVAALAKEFLEGVQRIKLNNVSGATDRAAWDALQAARGKSNYRGFRVFGAAFGSLITVFGLGKMAKQIYKGEAPDLNIATLGWAAVAAISVNPSLLWGASRKAVAELSALGSEQVRRVIAQGFKGAEGKKALDELQELRKEGNGRKILAMLGGMERINEGQLSALVDGSTGKTLVSVLSKMPEDKRSEALRVMSARLDDEQADLLKALM